MAENYISSPYTLLSTTSPWTYFQPSLTPTCSASISPPNQWFSDFEVHEMYFSTPHLQSFWINSSGVGPKNFHLTNSQVMLILLVYIACCKNTAPNCPLPQSLLPKRYDNATPFLKTLLDYHGLENKNQFSQFSIKTLPPCGYCLLPILILSPNWDFYYVPWNLTNSVGSGLKRYKSLQDFVNWKGFCQEIK